MEKKDKNALLTIKNTISSLTVEPFLFFCLLGSTVRLVSFQSLLMDRSCRNFYGYPDDVCNDLDKHKPEQAASIEVGNNLFLAVNLLSSLPNAIVAIFLGPWSDKYTRKWPMIIASGGLLLEAIFTVLFTVLSSSSPMWFVAASFLAGISGGSIICLSAAFSYLSDITNDRSRSSRFAVLEFAFVSAFIFGNLLGGQIYKTYGYLAVMTMSPCMFGICFLYVIFLVKETKPPVPREERFKMFREIFRLDNIKQSYITCSKKRAGNIRLQIWLLIGAACLQRFSECTLAVMFPFARQVYGWDVTDFSNASIAFSFANAAVVIAVIPLLSNKFRIHEAALGLIGMMSAISKMSVAACAYREFMFYFAWMTGTLSNAAGIAVKSRISKLVRKEELGRAFSLLGTFESFTPLFGTTVFLQIYNVSNRFFPGLAFAVSALLLVPCAITFMWMMRMPTVSLAEFERDEEDKKAKPMKEMASSTYSKLEEEKY